MLFRIFSLPGSLATTDKLALCSGGRVGPPPLRTWKHQLRHFSLGVSVGQISLQRSAPAHANTPVRLSMKNVCAVCWIWKKIRFGSQSNRS